LLLSLQIISTGKYLVLAQDGTLTIELHTTMFNGQGDFFGSYSYPFAMPLAPNRAALKNAHYISTSSKLRVLWVMIRLGAEKLPYKKVKMSFTIQDDTVQANCYFDATLISAQLSNLQLWQLNPPDIVGTEVFSTVIAAAGGLAAYMKSTVTAAPGTMPMVFAPFRDKNAYTSEPTEVTALYSAGNYNAATNSPVLHNNSGTGILPATALGGWRYLCTASGTPDFGAGAVIVTAGDYVMFDGDTWYAPLNPLGTRSRDDLYTDLVFPFEQVINRWQMDALGNGSFLVDNFPSERKQTQSPLFFAWVMLKRICDFFGFAMEGRVLTEDWFLRIVIWSRVAVGPAVIADIGFFMPGISAADFLKEMRTRFGLMIDFDMTNMVCTVESLQNLIKTNGTADLRALQIKSYRETTNTSTFYVISESVDGEDQSFPSGDVLPTLQIGDSLTQDTETDITLSSVATNMIVENAAVDTLLTTPVLATWRIPEIDVPISAQVPLAQISTVAYADQNNFKLRFLVWHGMVPNSGGFQYPLVSPDTISIAGGLNTNLTLGMSPGNTDYSLTLLYFQFLMASKPFEMGMELSIKKLLDIKANSRILVKDPFNFASISCILDQLAADLQHDEKKIGAKITLYPVIQNDNAAQVTPVIPVTPPPPPFDNGLVYVRFSTANPTEIVETMPTEANSFFHDLVVSFFSDLAGTVPKSVTTLHVGYSTTETFNTSTTTVTGPTFAYVDCSGTVATLYAAAPYAENYTDGSGWNIIWVYALLSSAHYTIIS
jgi:hypothetical protein